MAHSPPHNSRKSKRRGKAAPQQQPQSPPPKSTQGSVHDRVGELIALTRQGRGSRRELLQHATKSWGIGVRTADEYIARMRAELRGMLDVDAADARAEIMVWHREAFAIAIERRDPKAATAAGRELSKLLDLYPKSDAAPTTDPLDTIKALLEAAQKASP